MTLNKNYREYKPADYDIFLWNQLTVRINPLIRPDPSLSVLGTLIEPFLEGLFVKICSWGGKWYFKDTNIPIGSGSSFKEIHGPGCHVGRH